MVYLILGENTYKAEQELARIVADAKITPERLDAGSLTANTLADIVRGGSLFSEKRLVVLRQLSDNKPVFEKLAEWAGELTGDTTLILIEPKLDKRTKAYKTLTKKATVITAEPLTERDHVAAEQWLDTLASKHGVHLSRAQIRDMVNRVLVASDKPAQRTIDQMQLARSIKALEGVSEVTDDMIATILPPAAGDTVFVVLEFAAARQHDKLATLLEELSRNEDGHQTFALLTSQWAQLVSVALADTPPATIAVELGIHPFVAKKFAELSQQFTRSQLKDITTLAADLDAKMKLSQVTPWDGIHRLVYAISSRTK